MALFIMFILFAIALTFFTVSRIQLRTSTNVGNTVRAELLGEAATALAINMLKKDAVEHPNVTSTDHAWTTYFNGLWAAEKLWTKPPWQPNIANGGIPIIFYNDYTYVDRRTGDIFNARGVRGSGGELMPHLYVPRVEQRKEGNLTGFIENPETDYDPRANRFVIDHNYDARTAAEIIDKPYPQQFPDLSYCDVDNDGDGKKDSIWIPLAQDYLFQKDEGVFGPADVDFNLDGKEGEDRSAILFYPGTYEPRNGVEAWFLTAPINDPDSGYITLYNLNQAGLPFNTPVSTAPADGLVDSIDNDYDGIINYHIEYYTYWRDKNTTPGPIPLQEGDEKKRILYEPEFERLLTLAYTEILPIYLDPNGAPTYRICTTGEPMCELAGRAAILIRDEASKVNMNVAGAHYLDVPFLFNANLDPDYIVRNLEFTPVSDLDFTDFWKPCFGSGASTGEYLTWLLPRVGPGHALKFWNLLMGAPNGSMRTGDDFDGYIAGTYLYDVTLPGYGFVDDNANALLLAMNGIDDNGNGLIDEGTNPADNLTPEQIDAAWAYADRTGLFAADEGAPFYVNPAQSAGDIARNVYALFMGAGILEGVDEPAEFQFNGPVRNAVAEGKVALTDGSFDTADNDLDGSVNEIGEMGDRPMPTRDYLKRAVANERNPVTGQGINPNSYLDRLRPFVTIDSGARNNRTTRDEEGNIETLGPKLNYDLASAAQMAKAFIEEWKLDEALVYHGEDEDGNPLDPYAQLGYRYLPDDVNRYLSGDMRPDEQEVFPFNAFLAGMRIEGVNQTGVSFDLGGAPRPLNLPPDPRLQAMQLAVNIADAADADHARTELSTNDLQLPDFDPWWYALQKADGATDQEASRAINYTVAGAEAIRINEIMVRPVRRVEAETYGDEGFLSVGTEARYNPNIPFDSFFNVTRQKVADGRSVARTDYVVSVLNDELLWNLEPDFTVPNSGVVGNAAAIVADKGKLQLQLIDTTEDPPVSVAFEAPNILEFRFGPSEQLPPGRYYLTVNTVDPATGQPTITKGEEGRTRYLIKYVRAEGSTADSLSIRPKPDFSDSLDTISVDTSGISIIDDILADEAAKVLDPTFVSRLTWFHDDAVLGYENQKNKDGLPSGLVFLSGESDVDDTNFPDDTLGPDRRRGYVRGFQAHTVTIPHYEPGLEQAYLHVAIYCDDTIASENFSINFFDFSQEPDHEWVEIENVSSQPIDLSGWQLTVGAPDPEGNISSGDKAEMEVPAGTVIDSMPPYNRLLLAVSAFSPPIPADPDNATLSPLFNDNPFMWNGIGQVGTPGYLIYPFPDDETTFFDAGDTTVPLIPARLDTGPGIDGRGEVDPTVPPSPFEASDAPIRVVQLKVSGLNANLLPITDIKKFMADWVLGGGVFPNYPEHDGIDNDYDDHLIGLNNAPAIMGRDGIDHNGDDDATGAGEGVDEGRLWMDSPVQIHAGAGSFNIMPFALLYDLMPSLYPGDLRLSPEWKEFIERRFSPGDNVFVSLYQGPHQQKRVVDRITYTERDVINRAIDEGVDADGNPISTIVNDVPVRPSLHDQSGAFTEAYKTFWPDNTMGLDFYRSIERKYHPLYNGDRFGTQNRWQATDGNYDDWSHEPVAVGSPKWHGSPLERNDAAFSIDQVGLLQQLGLVDVRNKSFDSLGDLLSLPYFTLVKNYAPYADPMLPGLVAGFQPSDDAAGNIQSLMEGGVTDAIYLSPGAATVRDAAASAAQLACSFVEPCGTTEYELPQAWRPFFLYEISFGTDVEPAPAGLPADGNYWLFNGPGEQRAAGLEDPAVLRSRWPVEKRIVLLASRNLDSTTSGNATVYLEWDASAGLQDGTYDMYIDTGLKLLDVSPDTLTLTGQFVRCRVMENVTERPAVNVTVYTDTNGDGAITPIRQNSNSKDSLGKLTMLTPDSRGYVYCGSVSVNNNRLALDVENAVQPPADGISADTLNTFAGVILTPRARTQGRINVNTVETRLYSDSGGVTRRLNVLAGIPGVFQDYPMSFTGEPAYTFSVTAAVPPNGAYEFSVIFRSTGDNCYLLRVKGGGGAGPGLATLYSVLDGAMESLISIPFTDAEVLPVSVAVENDGQFVPSFTLIVCTINDATFEKEMAIDMLMAGTVGLISAMAGVGFSNPTFLPVGNVPFSRGWSGVGWSIDDTGLYRYGGGSTSTLFTGYPPDDLLYSTDFEVRKLTTAPDANDPNDIRRTFVRAEWLASSRAFVKRAAHWDGRYFDSINDLLESYPDRYPNDPRDDDQSFWPLVIGVDLPGGPDGWVPDYLATQALLESAWRLSRSANLLTTRSDIFEILVTVQAGTGEDLDGDGVINYRSPEEFTVTSERKTRTVYERP